MFTVANDSELLNALRRIDISVPLRSEGRKTKHVEVWTICRLLSTLSNARRLKFPLTLWHRDRPDFRLRSANTEIGVEIAEAVPERYAAYSALGERHYPDAILEPSHFFERAATFSADDLKGLLGQEELSGKPSLGDRSERDWALFICGVIEKKFKKLAHSEFLKLPLNYLLIYDNLPLFPINIPTAVSFLRPILNEPWTRNPNFDVVFIERDSVIVEISARQTAVLKLNDLWR